ncbi:hypothetical protein ES708_30418 [subsurface metagenome]
MKKNRIKDRKKETIWVAKRKIYINKKSTRTQQKTIENYSDEASKFDKEVFYPKIKIYDLRGRVIGILGY